jgi:hypothetical protein
MTTTTAGTTVPGWLRDALDWVGIRWPEGDVSGLSKAGSAWLTLAGGLREQATVAGRAAKAVWQAPQAGQFVEDFAAWWQADLGPDANLTRAAAAAERIGAALRGLAVQITILRAAYVAQLVALVTTLAAAGLLIVGTGGLAGLAAGAGSAALITAARRAMMRALQAGVATVGAVLIGQLLRRAAENLRPVRVPSPARQPQTRPGRDPDPLRDPLPIPIPWGWDENQRPRCRVSPDAIIPTTPVVTGGADPRTFGGAIIRVDEQRLDGGARQVTVDGIVQDTVARQGYERKLGGLAESIGLPAGEYHASHLYGRGFGSEAAAGIYLAPTEVNLSFHTRAEGFIQDLYQTAGPGGWVELRAVATTHPTDAWNNAGANLLASTDYEATVCRQNTVLETYRFGVEVGPPSGPPGGAVRRGRISVYGMP